MNIPFIKYAKLWYVITIIVVLLSSASLFKYGLKYGIDFTGGSLLEVSFSQTRPAVDKVKAVLDELGLKETVIQGSGGLQIYHSHQFFNRRSTSVGFAPDTRKISNSGKHASRRTF